MTDVVNQTEPYNITVLQGRSWSLSPQYCQPDGVTPIDLTGYVGAGQVREYAGGPLLAEFAATIDGPTGTVTLELSAAQTLQLKHRAVYDVKLTSGSSVIGLLYGVVLLIPEVTQ